VTEFVRQPSPRFGPRNDCRPLRTLLCLLLLLFSVLVGITSSKASGIQNGSTLSSSPGLTIAIADFDGDRRLDLASVQPGRNESGSSTYWIQFQFSASGRQFVQLIAPAGGLGIEARDVNGDHAVDLIFTTAWFHQPVAVLLNDGHGGFSRLEPSAFPAAFDETSTSWTSGARPDGELVALPAQSRGGVDHARKDPSHHCSLAGKILLSTPDFPIAPVVFIPVGRAPPSAVINL
jgi:hypothetical protein